MPFYGEAGEVEPPALGYESSESHGRNRNPSPAIRGREGAEPGLRLRSPMSRSCLANPIGHRTGFLPWDQMALILDLLFIFVLRALDVGMATVRIVLLARGRKGTAAMIGFFEALIWVIAVARVLSALDDPARMIAFAAGFAAGTYIGSIVEEWLAIGQALVRIVTPSTAPPIASLLRERGFGATVVNGDGLQGEVRVIFSVMPRKAVDSVLAMISEVSPEAYVTIDDTASIDLHKRHERTVRK